MLYYSLYKSATSAQYHAGRSWYPDTLKWCQKLATRYKVSTECVAGIVAALAQRTPWRHTKVLTEACLARKRPKYPIRTAARKARAIRNGASPLTVLRGPKITAFYHAILGDPEAVVIDVHMARAAGYGKSFDYSELARMLKREAQSLGIVPSAYQAIVWCVIRGNGE